MFYFLLSYSMYFMYDFVMNTCCLWQGYGIFIILWQFLLPLIIFVVAYWKILVVVRRQAKVAADRHRNTKSDEPVAGPSRETAETANAASSKDENQRDEVVVKGAVMAGTKVRGQVVKQQAPTSLSKAEINVVRTMVYITVCFVVCWLPMYTVIMLSRAVRQIKCRVVIVKRVPYLETFL